MMALEKQYHDELKMELQGNPYSSSASDKNKQISGEDGDDGEAMEDESLPDVQDIANDAANMSTLLMSRKTRGLYEAMKVILWTLICCI